MVLSEINPFVRYARHLYLTENSVFHEVCPLDARLFYSLEGHSKIKIKQTVYEMAPGTALIINSGVPYHILTPESLSSYIAINFDYTLSAAHRNIPVIPAPLDEYKPDLLINHNTFDDVKGLSEVLYAGNINIQKKLTDIVNEYSIKMMYHNQKAGHMLADCIIDCVRKFEFKNSNIEKHSASIILNYIHENYKSSLTNSEIGKFFGYHKNYVSYLIKQMTGMPLHKYIINVRLMNAVSLLDNTSLSVSEIAFECGFPSAAYFSAYFKKNFSVSPSKYRNV